MLIEENLPQSGSSVITYESGRLLAGGQAYASPLLCRNGAVEVWTGKMLPEMTAADFFQTASGQDLPEVIIVGTGSRQQFIHPKIVADLAQQGIGLECMNTSAACRTLLLLQAENRSVWAWLWP